MTDTRLVRLRCQGSDYVTLFEVNTRWDSMWVIQTSFLSSIGRTFGADVRQAIGFSASPYRGISESFQGAGGGVGRRGGHV